MLHLLIKAKHLEFFNEETQEFVNIDCPLKDTEIALEHSLVSISKWEAKWHKPYLKNDENDQLTSEELLDYIKCMVMTQNVDLNMINYLSNSELKEITDYMKNPMTATTFNIREKKKSREILTSEVIYYLMASYQIPFECQKWHINRLLTLIQVCSIKNNPGKNMSQKDMIKEYSRINEVNKAKYYSRRAKK